MQKITHIIYYKNPLNNQNSKLIIYDNQSFEEISKLYTPFITGIEVFNSEKKIHPKKTKRNIEWSKNLFKKNRAIRFLRENETDK